MPSYLTLLHLGWWGSYPCLLATFAFIRHPVFSLCESNNPCKCSHLEHIRDWYAPLCHQNATFSDLELKSITYRDDNLFDDLDAGTLLTLACTGAGTMAIIMLSILLARSKQRKKIHSELEISAANLKCKLGEKLQRIVNIEMQEKQSREAFSMLEPYRVPRSHVALEMRTQVLTVGMACTMSRQYCCCQAHTFDKSIRTVRISKEDQWQNQKRGIAT